MFWRTLIALPMPIIAGLLARAIAGWLARRKVRRMIYFVDGLLWVIAIGLGLIAMSRSRKVFRDSVTEGAMDCVRLDPAHHARRDRLGYIAALLPQEVMGNWFGADSGIARNHHRGRRRQHHAWRADGRLLDQALPR